MLEYACQRIYRDARITSIYEGTTQLQTVAAIRYVTSGFYSNVLNDYLQEEVAPEFAGLKSTAAAMVKKYEEAVAKVNAAENDELHDFLARRLYEMAADCIMSLLIIKDASNRPDLFAKSANVYVRFAESEIEKHYNYVMKFDAALLPNFRQVEAPAAE